MFDAGYVYMDTDGTLRYVDLTAPSTVPGVTAASVTMTSYIPAPQPGATFTVTPAQANTLLTTTVGASHEAAGPQKTDCFDLAKATSDAMCAALEGWAQAMAAAERARPVSDAISALHRQHTRDGRPSRFIPEVE